MVFSIFTDTCNHIHNSRTFSSQQKGTLYSLTITGTCPPHHPGPKQPLIYLLSTDLLITFHINSDVLIICLTPLFFSQKGKKEELSACKPIPGGQWLGIIIELFILHISKEVTPLPCRFTVRETCVSMGAILWPETSAELRLRPSPTLPWKPGAGGGCR